jgi:hypothetical protein
LGLAHWSVGKIEQALWLLYLEFWGTMQTFLLDESYETVPGLTLSANVPMLSDEGKYPQVSMSHSPSAKVAILLHEE